MHCGSTNRPGRNWINAIAEAEGWRRAAQYYSETERSQSYDYSYEYICNEARADFRFLFSLPERDKILDLGSGWGTVSMAFARSATEVYALDSTLGKAQFVAIRAREEQLPNVHPVCADCLEIPFEDEYFDLVVMDGMLKWVAVGRDAQVPYDCQMRALEGIWRVLKPGGKLYIGTENRYSYKNLLGSPDLYTGLRFIALLLRPLANLYSRLLRGRDYQALTHSRGRMKAMLSQAGFERIDFFYPLPDCSNLRYILDYRDQSVSRFCLQRLRVHPRFTIFHYVLGKIGLALGLGVAISPCFGIVAER